MHITTLLALGGSIAVTGISLWRRQWLSSLAWAFCVAYNLFDKALPGVLPTGVVLSFSWTFAALVACEVFRKRRQFTTDH